MRTAVIIVCGFLLWAACLAFAKLAAGATAASLTAATIGFALLWFVAAALNLWFGVTRAGYAFGEELPIFLLIFSLPVAVAAAVRWKWL
jgi:hypothetical protein